jgi:large subunit ribosomal protein L28
MAKICAITGKRPLVGNNVSHSNRKTKRRQMPNLQKKVVINPATGRAMTIMVTGRGIRTLTKWLAEGKKVDLRTLVA